MREHGLLVHREPHAQPEFGIVFEQGIRPRRAAAFPIHRVRRGRQVAAVDRRASGGIGDQQTVAKKLREEFDVGRFAAAGASAGKFEERLEKLRVFHLSVGNALAVEFGQRKEKLPVGALLLAERCLHFHVDGLMFHFALALSRADFHTQAAAGAVFRRNLEGVTQGCKFAPARLGGLEGGRRVRQEQGIVDFGANHGVRANHHALPALDTKLCVPNRNLLRDIALFPLRGGGRESAVDGQGADGQGVAVSGDDRADNLAHKGRGARRNRREHVKRCGNLFRNFH